MLSSVAQIDFHGYRIDGISKHFRCAFCNNRVFVFPSCIARCLDMGSVMCSRVQALFLSFLPSVVCLFSCSMSPPSTKMASVLQTAHSYSRQGEGKSSGSCVPWIRTEQSLVKLPQAQSLLSHWMVLYHMAILAAKDIGTLGVSHFSDSVVEGRQGRSWEWVLRWLNNSFLLQWCTGNLDWNVFGEMNFLGHTWMRRSHSGGQEVLLESDLPFSYLYWWRPWGLSCVDPSPSPHWPQSQAYLHPFVAEIWN